MPPQTLILASRSPQRRRLLETAGYQVQVIPPRDAAESAIRPGEAVAAYVARLALEKAADVTARIEHGRVVACDTVAECEGRVLGKPIDVEDARRILRSLRGREHRVYSGLCVWDYPRRAPLVDVDCTVLRMAPLSDRQIDEYLASGLWREKAGAFGYQDRLDWLQVIEGHESNVVGLPMELLSKMLRQLENTNAGQEDRPRLAD